MLNLLAVLYFCPFVSVSDALTIGNVQNTILGAGNLTYFRSDNFPSMAASDVEATCLVTSTDTFFRILTLNSTVFIGNNATGGHRLNVTGTRASGVVIALALNASDATSYRRINYTRLIGANLTMLSFSYAAGEANVAVLLRLNGVFFHFMFSGILLYLNMYVKI